MLSRPWLKDTIKKLLTEGDQALSTFQCRRRKKQSRNSTLFPVLPHNKAVDEKFKGLSEER